MKKTNKKMPQRNYRKGWPSQPTSIIIHFTAGYNEDYMYKTLKSSGISVHKAIERDGEIFEYVSDADRSFHAGKSSWNGVSFMNNHSFGLELVNFGICDGQYMGKAPGLIFRQKDPKNKEREIGTTEFYRDETFIGSDGRMKQVRVITKQGISHYVDHRKEFSGKLWTTYPVKQIDATAEVVFEWVKKFGILPENIIGHEHISPGRKTDPGRAMPWRILDAKILSMIKKEASYLSDPSFKMPDRVKAVQSHCARLGLEVGVIDGIWGDITKGCVFEAFKVHSETYSLAEIDISKDNCMNICYELKLIPGFSVKGR